VNRFQKRKAEAVPNDRAGKGERRRYAHRAAFYKRRQIRREPTTWEASSDATCCKWPANKAVPNQMWKQYSATNAKKQIRQSICETAGYQSTGEAPVVHEEVGIHPPLFASVSVTPGQCPLGALVRPRHHRPLKRCHGTAIGTKSDSAKAREANPGALVPGGHGDTLVGQESKQWRLVVFFGVPPKYLNQVRKSLRIKVPAPGGQTRRGRPACPL